MRYLHHALFKQEVQKMLQLKSKTTFKFAKNNKLETLCLPFYSKGDKVVFAQKATSVSSFFKVNTLPKEFYAKRGEVCSLYLDKQYKKQVLLLGLGPKEEVDDEEIKKAYGSLVKNAHRMKLTELSILPVMGDKDSTYLTSVCEALYSANYRFDKYKKVKSHLLKSVDIIGENISAPEKGLKGIYQGVYLARDLVNQNADEADANHLSNLSKKLSKQYAKLQVKILGEKELKKVGCNLILAVNQASKRKPALIIFQYKGDPKSKKNLAIIGKGVTYDTGGLSLKPSSGMLNMKSDMSGAAAVLGTVEAVCRLKLKQNVIFAIPVVENCIGAGSYKVGDVFTAYNKKTVEVVNTDAEGRLILADALAYIDKNYKPDCLVDICTLTGAVVVALGEEASGLMSNSDALAESITKQGKYGLDRVWRLPLFREYEKLIDSKIADLKNSGGRAAASITAALFLKEFVKQTKWAHLDIAGTAFQEGKKEYLPKGATGVGVSLLSNWIKSKPKF